MKFLDTLKNIQPKDNDAKKVLIGDGVYEVEDAKIVNSQKTGKDYIIVSYRCIHPIERKEGDNIKYGDVVDKVYDTEDEKAMQKFADDCFTAGFEIDTTDEFAFAESLKKLIGKLAYIRAWESNFTNEEGEEIHFNRVVIKNKKLIKDEYTVPKKPY